MNVRVRLIACGFALWFATVAAQAQSVAEQYLFQAANAERAQHGLPALRWDATLYHAAATHAAEMAKRQSISHQYAGEADLSARGKAAGARFSTIAENVAMAPTAIYIHDAWMKSPGHRANILDSQVDSVGISVLSRNGQLYAVQDFDRSVASLTFDEQERRVSSLIGVAANVEMLPASDNWRQTCLMSTGYAGAQRPWFVMRYTAADLSRLPEQLKTELQTGKFHHAAVGACSTHANQQAFTSYSIAVLLYP